MTFLRRTGFWAVCGALALSVLSGAAALAAENKVLVLNGKSSSLALPSALLNGSDGELTIEGWFRWDRFAGYGPAFSLGKPWHMIGINNRDTTPTLQFFIYGDRRVAQTIQVQDVLKLHEWYHLAAVAGTNGMRLYLNNVLVGEHPYARGIRGLPTDGRLLLGQSLWDKTPDWVGQIDQLRFWSRELTGDEVQRLMTVREVSNEAGLLAEYSFDSGRADDSGPRGFHGVLNGSAGIAVQDRPLADQVPVPTRLWGKVYDDAAHSLAGAALRLYLERDESIATQSDSRGFYQFVWFPQGRPVDLSAISGELGLWQTNLFVPGRGVERDLVLRPAISLAGRVLTWDGDPVPDKLVQVIREGDAAERAGRVAAAVRTDDRGRYRFINLRSGSYRVRCLAQGKFFYHTARGGDVSTNSNGTVVHLDADRMGEQIDFHISGGQTGHWMTFDFMDGLPGDNVLSLAQDRDGYLWLGTEYSGAARFDGKQFVALTTADGLPDNKINAIRHEASGAVWFGTTRGLARYAGGAWQLWNTTNGLPDNYVECLLPDGADGMWIGTRGGLVFLRGGQMTTWTSRNGLAGDLVQALARDRHGELWIGTTSGASRKQQDGFQTFTTGDGLAENNVRSIVEAEDGSLWFGTWSRGVSRYDGRRFTSLTINEGLVDNAVRQIYRTAAGVLWIATKGGVTRYESGALASFQASDGLVPGEIWTVHQTADRQLWFGSRGGGLSCYDEETFKFLSAQDGLADNAVRSLARQPGGPLWIGTAKGVSRYDGHQMHTFTTREGLVSDEINVLAASSTAVWLGTPNGVARWEGNQWSRPDRFPALAGRLVRGIATGPGNEAWFAVYGAGLFHFDGREIRPSNLAVQSGGGFTTSVLREPGGSLWVGSRELVRIQPSGVTRYTAREGLNAAEIKALEIDDRGRPWVGTPKGLLRGEGGRFESIVTGDLLGNHSIHSIRQAADGRIWCATTAGVTVYDGTNSSLLDSRDGLSANDVRQVWCDDDGSVWFGTANGLNQYRPRRTPPAVKVRVVRSSRVQSDLQRLPAFTVGSAVAIEYSSIDFRTHLDKRRYRCQMVWLGDEPAAAAGMHAADWSAATGNSTFDWVPERTGWFHFAVQAIDRDLNYSEPAVLLLHAVAPWYSNPWITAPVLAVIAALAFGTVFSTWRYWVKRRESQLARVRMQAQEAFSHEVLTRQEEERKRIAAELHDSLGQSLLVMKSRALMALQKPDNPSALVAQLTEISDTASQAIAETRQIAFNLRPHQLDSLGLHKGLAAMANQVCHAAALQLTTDIDNVSGLVTPESQIHLFRIAQEALNNVVKHAQASAVRLELKITGDSSLILRIEDNGLGMETGSSEAVTVRTNPGHGTNNLTERVRFLRGRLDITASSSGGTAVTVTVPRANPGPPPET